MLPKWQAVINGYRCFRQRTDILSGYGRADWNGKTGTVSPTYNATAREMCMWRRLNPIGGGIKPSVLGHWNRYIDVFRLNGCRFPLKHKLRCIKNNSVFFTVQETEGEEVLRIIDKEMVIKR
jgi:hypothetical protein